MHWFSAYWRCSRRSSLWLDRQLLTCCWFDCTLKEVGLFFCLPDYLFSTKLPSFLLSSSSRRFLQAETNDISACSCATPATIINPRPGCSRSLNSASPMKMLKLKTEVKWDFIKRKWESNHARSRRTRGGWWNKRQSCWKAADSPVYTSV